MVSGPENKETTKEPWTLSEGAWESVDSMTKCDWKRLNIFKMELMMIVKKKSKTAKQANKNISGHSQK